MVMHLRPELVREQHITDNPRHLPSVEVINDYKVDFVRPWHLYIPASAGGNATKASAEKGKIVAESAIEGMGRFFSELSLAPDTDTFPY
jgi:creatinine amidohydrolase/Fe(II)-dependent formamide hydrolase-like protein